MGQKLPADQMALYKRVDEILWNDWDPIGVSGIAEARDEYCGYLPDIFSRALNRAQPAEIADRLHWIETVMLGLTGSRDHCLWVAQRICDARREFIKDEPSQTV
jgi:hypothetical protein